MAYSLAVSNDRRGGWHPGIACDPRPALSVVPSEPRAIVHVIELDEAAGERVGDLVEASGMEARCHASLGAFADAEPSDAPACLIVHARLALSGELASARLPVIVTGDKADVRTAVLAMKAGAVDFLERPLRDREILMAVSAAIEAHRAQRQSRERLNRLCARYETLTPRERQVMALVTQGLLNKQVAGDLGLSEITVKVHRGSVMRKMAVRTLAELVRIADAVGMDDPVRSSS